MPSNDTPPRPFVPKTEAERESVKEMVAAAREAGRESYNGRGVLLSDRDYAERTVPKVPRVKRVVEINWGQSRYKVTCEDGKLYLESPNGEKLSYRTPEHVAFRVRLPDDDGETFTKLRDLVKNPDEPAQPAAAQGGANVVSLSIEGWSEIMRLWPDGASIYDVDENALNAKLQTLLGAVPVGRADAALTDSDCMHVAHAVIAVHEKRNVSHTGTLYITAVRDALRGLAPTVVTK